MKTSIIVQNLKCGGCAKTITNKLLEIDIISDVKVNVDESKVSFNANTEADVIVIKEKLKSLGYPSIEDNNSISSKAKSFVSCATGKFSN